MSSVWSSPYVLFKAWSRKDKSKKEIQSDIDRVINLAKKKRVKQLAKKYKKKKL